MRVTLHPDIDPGQIRKGNEVVLNESLNVVLVRDGELSGEVVTLKEQLEDKRRCVVFARADEERVAELSEEMLDTKLRSGDSLLMDIRTAAAHREAAQAREREPRPRRGARHHLRRRRRARHADRGHHRRRRAAVPAP